VDFKPGLGLEEGMGLLMGSFQLRLAYLRQARFLQPYLPQVKKIFELSLLFLAQCFNFDLQLAWL